MRYIDIEFNAATDMDLLRFTWPYMNSIMKKRIISWSFYPPPFFFFLKGVFDSVCWLWFVGFLTGLPFKSGQLQVYWQLHQKFAQLEYAWLETNDQIPFKSNVGIKTLFAKHTQEGTQILYGNYKSNNEN